MTILSSALVVLIACSAVVIMFVVAGIVTIALGAAITFFTGNRS